MALPFGVVNRTSFLTSPFYNRSTVKGYWQLIGNGLDNSGNGFNGTVSGTPVYRGKSKYNKNGYAYVPSSSGYDVSSSAVPSISQPHTFVAWVRPNIGGSYEKTIWGANLSSGSNAFLVRFTSSTNIQAGWFGNSNGTFVNASVLPTNDELMCVVYVSTGSSSHRIYVNGVLKEAGAFSGSSGTTSQNGLNLGYFRNQASNAIQQQYDGFLAEMFLDFRAWSSKEISDYYTWATNMMKVDNTPLLKALGTGAVNVTVSATCPNATFSIPAYTATAIQNVTNSPAVQSATFSIPAYTVKTDVSIAPAVQSATFSIPAYNAYANDVIVNPAVQSATFSIPSYVADAVRNVTVSGTTPSATFSIPAYTVQISVSNSPNVQSATFSIPAYATDGTQSVSISASVQAMTFSIPAYQADAIRNATIAPNMQTLTFSVPSYTVAVVANITASPSVVSAIFSIPTYRITADFWQNKYPSSANTSWNNKY